MAPWRAADLRPAPERIYDHYVPVLVRKPGALRNGAPFKDWVLPAAMERVRRKLAGADDGNVLMVTRIDRLARSIGDLQDIVRTVRAKGASLKATEQPIDTSTAAGKCFLDMLGVFAEFETNLRRERQLEGIAKAKAAGVYKGRPASIDATKVRQLKTRGMGASEIAKALKIGRASVYRVLGERG
jgi:DNA invertase Pin-like site-specific DNA recombinase